MENFSHNFKALLKVGGPGQDVNKTCIQKTSEWYDLDLIKISIC